MRPASKSNPIHCEIFGALELQATLHTDVTEVLRISNLTELSPGRHLAGDVLSKSPRRCHEEVTQVAEEITAMTTRCGLLPPEPVVLGTSCAMKEVRDKLEKIAFTDVPVLIRGEAGSGKEVLARLIHKKHPGDYTPFHKVSPAGRAGWRKSDSFVLSQEEVNGANGSSQYLQEGPGRPGCIGTLFFDEVAELNPASQRNLTHLLHDDRPSGIGLSDYPPPLFRVICSTRHDLEREMSLGNFREDLFYSINIVSLHLPPLRARCEDIPGLAWYFWESYREELNSSTPAPATRLVDVLQGYGWPGNIRELAGVMKRYVLLGSADKIVEELATRTALPGGCKTSSTRGISLKKLAKQEAQELERKIIFKTLRETQWNRKQAARALNISYRTLLYKIKEAGVPPKRIFVKRETEN
ncbi:MAG: sigma-54-dependent Fis family transcriptional regulator [Acidobacteria bacterium]|nr:MAG: sigma-54-dependent Fis family transcriptional regulator [Acidobacteriota bacterium]